MNRRKIYKLFGIGSIVLLTIYGIFRYFETPKDTRRIRTEASLNSKELISIMSNKADSTLYQYIEKAIEIESVIKEITFKEGKYTLLLHGDDNNTFILCEMQKNQNDLIKKLQVGDVVVVKGVLKGFLKDAILLNCIFV